MHTLPPTLRGLYAVAHIATQLPQGKSMCEQQLTVIGDAEARQLSSMLSTPDMFPEARQQITRDLLDYYKALLYRTPDPAPRVVRRMWG